MSLGASVLAAAAIAAPAAEAKPFHHSAGSEAELSQAAPLPEFKDARDGAKVLREMLFNIRPNIVSSAVLQLNPGTFLAYGPLKNSRGEVIPKGMVSFMEFPQLAVVDGRIMARGLYNDGTVDDKTVNSLNSRWVDINASTVLFYYLQLMDPSEGYPLVLPAFSGGGNNLASNAKWFNGARGAVEGLQGPLRGMQLAFLLESFPAKYAASQRNYWAAKPEPGPKPRFSDITNRRR